MRSISLAALVAVAGVANAGSFAWDWNSAPARNHGTAGNNNGGTMQDISASYNQSTEVFSWAITYSDQITEGFTLAVNNGPNPKGSRHELALIYFDADVNGDSTVGDVNVTAYEYSGQNNSQSWNNPGVLLNQSGDADFILNASAQDNSDGTRTFVLEFDASTINAFYDTATHTDWTGIGFDSLIGVWYHSFAGLNTSYDSEGKLTQWSRSSEGWLDFSNRNTTAIPMPLAGAMGCAGLGLVIGRRRR
jgi:hypothetical protein